MAEYLDSNEFLKDFADGKKEAFDAFFHGHWDRLFVYAYNLVGQEDEAEDITIDCISKLYIFKTGVEGIERFESIENIRAKIYVMIRNKCFDSIKVKNRLPERVKIYWALVNKDPEMENAMMHGDAMDALYKAMNQLPEKYYNVLNLMYFDKMKYKEVAERLGISVDSVKTMRRIAIAKLRTCMSPEQIVLVASIYTVMTTPFH